MGGSAGGLEAFEQFFSNMPSDTGMAFALVPHLDPTHKGIMPELLQRHTKMKVVQIEDGMQVQGSNCRWHHMRILPYRTSDNMIDGVVITFADITANKQLEESLDRQKAEFNKPAFTPKASSARSGNRWSCSTTACGSSRRSPSFYETFQVTPAQIEGRYLYDICQRQWDIPALRQLLEDILPKNTEFEDFRVEQDFSAIGHKVLLLNARQVGTKRPTYTFNPARHGRRDRNTANWQAIQGEAMKKTESASGRQSQGAELRRKAEQLWQKKKKIQAREPGRKRRSRHGSRAASAPNRIGDVEPRSCLMPEPPRMSFRSNTWTFLILPRPDSFCGTSRGRFSNSTWRAQSCWDWSEAPRSRNAFGQFVAVEDRPIFADFCKKVMQVKTKQTCEIKLLIDVKPLDVLIEGIAGLYRKGEGTLCRAAVIDITDRKQVDSLTKLMLISQAVLAETDMESMLQRIVDAADELIGAKFIVSGYNYAKALLP